MIRLKVAWPISVRIGSDPTWLELGLVFLDQS